MNTNDCQIIAFAMGSWGMRVGFVGHSCCVENTAWQMERNHRATVCLYHMRVWRLARIYRGMFCDRYRGGQIVRVGGEGSGRVVEVRKDGDIHHEWMQGVMHMGNGGRRMD